MRAGRRCRSPGAGPSQPEGHPASCCLEASNDQLAQLVANLQAKSDLYDVIDMDVIWTAEFASNGWIIPLPQSQFPLGDFLKPAVDTAMYQGRLYAVPDTATRISSTTARTSSPRRASSLPRPGPSCSSSPRPWRRSTACTATPALRPVRRADRQLRGGGPVGRRVDPLPRGHQGHRELGQGAAGARVPGERVPAGLDPQGRAHLRGGVGPERVPGRQVPVP